jgi:hypothetical protein
MVHGRLLLPMTMTKKSPYLIINEVNLASCRIMITALNNL